MKILCYVMGTSECYTAIWRGSPLATYFHVLASRDRAIGR